MFKKILIANDGSEGARHALKVAMDGYFYKGIVVGVSISE